MTQFHDGPAHGQSLMLRRCPIFLRVTVDNNGRWDALDQVGDEPRPEERVFAYRLDGQRGMCHVRMSRGRGGMFAMADYRLISDQPADAVLRDNAAWVEWVRQVYASEQKTT